MISHVQQEARHPEDLVLKKPRRPDSELQDHAAASLKPNFSKSSEIPPTPQTPSSPQIVNPETLYPRNL